MKDVGEWENLLGIVALSPFSRFIYIFLDILADLIIREENKVGKPKALTLFTFDDSAVGSLRLFYCFRNWFFHATGSKMIRWKNGTIKKGKKSEVVAKVHTQTVALSPNKSSEQADASSHADHDENPFALLPCNPTLSQPWFRFSLSGFSSHVANQTRLFTNWFSIDRHFFDPHHLLNFAPPSGIKRQ